MYRNKLDEDYGPIRFYSRRKKAPTLLTGRKSRYEELSGEEFQQRELRREKNRCLSKKLQEKREKIFNDLLEQHHQLEQNNFHLIHSINQLQFYKTNLLNQLENSNQQIYHQMPDETFLFDYLCSNQSSQ